MLLAGYRTRSIRMSWGAGVRALRREQWMPVK